MIAGSVDRADSRAPQLARVVAALVPGLHFDTDQYQRNVDLAEAGAEQVEQLLGCGGLHDPENLTLLSELNCALHAEVLLRRDVDYLVRRGRIEIRRAHRGEGRTSDWAVRTKAIATL